MCLDNASVTEGCQEHYPTLWKSWISQFWCHSMHRVHDVVDYWTVLWILDLMSNHSLCMSYNRTSRFEKSSHCSRIHGVVGDNGCEHISCLSIAIQFHCHSLLCQLEFLECWLRWRSHRHPILIQASLIYIECVLVWTTILTYLLLQGAESSLRS